MKDLSWLACCSAITSQHGLCVRLCKQVSACGSEAKPCEQSDKRWNSIELCQMGTREMEGFWKKQRAGLWLTKQQSLCALNVSIELLNNTCVHTGTVMRQDGWKWLLQIILAVNTQWTHHLESKDHECQQQIVTRSLLLCFPTRKVHSSLELCWLIEPSALVSVFCLRESIKCRPWNEWTHWIVM